jgi:hypothetical protein
MSYEITRCWCRLGMVFQIPPLVISSPVAYSTNYRNLSDAELERKMNHIPALPHLPALLSERVRIKQLTDDQKAAERHSQTVELGTKTLCWAKVGGTAGISAVLIAAVALIAQIYFSKVQPSKPATASPLSLPQTPATISESPEPEATASIAMPSPQPTETESPSATPPVPATTTPIKLPPPAP